MSMDEKWHLSLGSSQVDGHLQYHSLRCQHWISASVSGIESRLSRLQSRLKSGCWVPRLACQPEMKVRPGVLG